MTASGCQASFVFDDRTMLSSDLKLISKEDEETEAES